ncbi:MAG: cation-transporting P-type ATPase, partial [Polyangiales bacterium]
PHSKSGEEVQSALAPLGFDHEKGLSQADVVKLREKFGKNELPKAEAKSAILQFLSQFANPFVGALLAAAAIAVVIAVVESKETGSFFARYGDAIAILLIVMANAVLGFVQERRAEKALDALQKLGAPMATVVRAGETMQVPAVDLVPGDLLKLTAGDLVPADARLLQAHAVQTDESALTGESTPVGKDARDIAPLDAGIGERAAMLFLGTTLTAGEASAVVVSTGPGTELGRIGALMASAGDEQTPLERRLDSFGKKILYACLAISVLLFVYGFIAGNKPWHLLLLEAVSLAVAAIPEGLPAITTITLALGMHRMALHGAQIRKLPAVETLGSASIICSDKTGTLTQNEMTVREVWAGEIKYRVTGLGYDPDGAILRADAQEQVPAIAEQGDQLAAPLERLLRTAALCNNARFVKDDDGIRRVVGDPTEGALLVLAEKGGLGRESIAPMSRVVQQLPFDSDRKRMTVVTIDEYGRQVAHVKGGVDIILPRCVAMKMGAKETGEIPLDDALRDMVHRVADEMAARALRVLALARRRRPEGDPEEQLTLLGLVGMVDPPRPGVKKAITTAAAAGVRTVMITGDHRVTAEAIARELGIWEQGAEAMSGAEIEKASDEDLRTRIDRVRVYARVSAEHKLRIVRAFKARGEVVAMTGDGVNDAPAIREAQIGIAMGVGGTDVAREAADLVLLDNNFATIVEAIRQGRAIYRNIQKFIYFLLSSNAGLCVCVFATSFFPRLPSLTPLQILWINLVTNGLPALALGVDPADTTLMQEPPRPSNEGLLGAREYRGISVVGLWMGLVSIAVLWFGTGPNDPEGLRARAIAFSILAISPLFHAFNCRSTTASIMRTGLFGSRPLLAAVATSLVIHLVAVLVPVLQPVFKTYPMTLAEWGIMIAAAASIVPIIEIFKAVERARIGKVKDAEPASIRWSAP